MYLVATDSKGAMWGSVEITGDKQTIGRNADSGLRLQGQGVSRVHASVYLYNGQAVIADEGSANGVSVDGHPITQPTYISADSVVRLSEFRLTVWNVDPGAVPNASAMNAPTPRPVPDIAEEQDSDFLGQMTYLEAPPQTQPVPTGTLVLVGRGGPYDQTKFLLANVLCTVGRGESNHIVLEDPSVSRRHAQVRLAPDGRSITVLDLRSSNGTFVRGERVKRCEVEVGAIVRFGDLAFKLAGADKDAAQTRENRGRARRFRLVAALASLTMLLTVVGVVAYVKRRRGPTGTVEKPGDILRRRQAALLRLLEKARLKVAGRRWSEAIVLADKVIAKDPFNQEPKLLRAKALEELANQEIFDRAMASLALGNSEHLAKARALFLKVASESVYAREVRYKIRDIDQRVAQGYRIDGVSRCNARYYRRCYALLCRYFKHMPRGVAVAGEPGLRRRMAAVERRFRRKSSFSKCSAERYLHPAQEVLAGATAGELLAEKYPEPALRRIVSLYHAGKLDMALKRIGKLKDNRKMRPLRAKLGALSAAMVTIRGKYQQGYSFLRQRRADKADREFAALLAADSKLMPKGVTSFYRKDATRALAALYAEVGEERYRVKQLPTAYRNWSRSKFFDPENAGALNGLLRLEKDADRLLKEGIAMVKAGRIAMARVKLETARDICAVGDSRRQRAERALGELGQ